MSKGIRLVSANAGPFKEWYDKNVYALYVHVFGPIRLPRKLKKKLRKTGGACWDALNKQAERNLRKVEFKHCSVTAEAGYNFGTGTI